MDFILWKFKLKNKFFSIFFYFYTNIYFATKYGILPKKEWYKHILFTLSLCNYSWYWLVYYILCIYFLRNLEYLYHLCFGVYSIWCFILEDIKLLYKYIFIFFKKIILFFQNPTKHLYNFYINNKEVFSSNNWLVKQPFSFNYTYKSNFFFKNKLVYIFDNYLLYNYLYRFYIYFKNILIASFITIFFFIYLLFFLKILVIKHLSILFILFNIFFWIMSTFNFFLKHYRFGTFTSAIQRFWKRAIMYFWFVEGFLFVLFYYYFLNSSQEPLYMYDYNSLNQDYLLSLVSGYKTLLSLACIIFLSVYLLINISSFSFNQYAFLIIVISFLIFNMFFIETYQFYYVLTQFNEYSWVYDENLNSWQLTYEAPRLRTKYFYFLLCLLAKYWHFIFIFIGWLFFLVKSFEVQRVRYSLLGLHIQNLVILYFLNILSYIQWLKWIFKRFWDILYFWFYTDYDFHVFYLLYEEISLFFFSFFNINYSFSYYYNYILYSYQLFLISDTYLFNQLNLFY